MSCWLTVYTPFNELFCILIILHKPHVVRISSYSNFCLFCVHMQNFKAGYFILLGFTLFLIILFLLYTTLIVCKQLPCVSSHKTQSTWPFMLQELVKYYAINTWAVSHVIILYYVMCCCAYLPAIWIHAPKFKYFVLIIIHCTYFRMTSFCLF